MDTDNNTDKDNEKNDLIEIYKMYVQTAENVSDRRLRSNNFYLTLCSLLVTTSYAFLRLKIVDTLLIIGMSVFGLLFSIVWFFNIRSYKCLNAGKFQVIQKIEEKLSFACFTEEWKILKHTENRSNKYSLLTTIERFIPTLFIILFTILFLYSIYEGLCSGASSTISYTH